jgi:hypothetical protein
MYYDRKIWHTMTLKKTEKRAKRSTQAEKKKRSSKDIDREESTDNGMEKATVTDTRWWRRILLCIFKSSRVSNGQDQYY